MEHNATPHFQNSDGLPVIEIGSKEFMCIGSNPPFDHPHIYIDMGRDLESICPYCSTHYRFNASLKPGTANPADAVWHVVA